MANEHFKLSLFSLNFDQVINRMLTAFVPVPPYKASAGCIIDLGLFISLCRYTNSQYPVSTTVFDYFKSIEL